MTSLWAGWCSLQTQTRARHFSVLQNIQISSGAYPDSYSVVTSILGGEGEGGHIVGGHEVYHPPPSTAKVKNDWDCTSSPTLCLHDMDRNYTIFTSLWMKNPYMKTLEILVNFHDFHITCAAFWIFWIICKGWTYLNAVFQHAVFGKITSLQLMQLCFWWMLVTGADLWRVKQSWTLYWLMNSWAIAPCSFLGTRLIEQMLHLRMNWGASLLYMARPQARYVVGRQI